MPANPISALWRRLSRATGPGDPAPPPDLPDPREAVHFLHIGKTAGTQFARVADQINAAEVPVRIVTHRHWRRLRDLPEGARYAFSIRSPVGRFRSGFYSRKRKGRPRTHVPWTDHEARAFAAFEHANDLAEALFDPGPRGRLALAAMKSIQHLSMAQVEWFDLRGNFLALDPPIAILRQERFAADLDRFLAAIGFDGRITLDDDPVAAHRNDYDGTPALSARACENVNAWYAPDVAFYAMCEAWMEETRGR